MDEYICKNSVKEKPCEIRLFEFKLEWQRGEKKVSIPYANIVSVNLSKVRNKFTLRLESDYQGKIFISNRFYLLNGEFEDRSRQYNTFVRLLHHHLSKQKTTSFFTGSSMKKIWTMLSLTALSGLVFLWTMSYLLSYLNIWAFAFTSIVFLIAFALCLRQLPKAYSGNDIPIHYLPSI